MAKNFEENNHGSLHAKNVGTAQHANYILCPVFSAVGFSPVKGDQPELTYIAWEIKKWVSMSEWIVPGFGFQ